MAREGQHAGEVPDDEEIITIEGNIFAAMGLPDADVFSAKVDLAIAISRAIGQNGWTNTEAAERAGVAVADISKITRARVGGFTDEYLRAILNALGE